MSDFTSPLFGAITPELLVRSLVSGIIAQPTFGCGIRLQGVDTSQKTLSKVPVCATFIDLMTTFQRSLMMAYDGKVAIRTTTTTTLEGASIEECIACGNGYSIEELLSACFVQDEDGVVYLNLINITT